MRIKIDNITYWHPSMPKPAKVIPKFKRWIQSRITDVRWFR